MSNARRQGSSWVIADTSVSSPHIAVLAAAAILHARLPAAPRFTTLTLRLRAKPQVVRF
jgi:hypothetical protein